jgi:hypothetical protein
MPMLAPAAAAAHLAGDEGRPARSRHCAGTTEGLQYQRGVLEVHEVSWQLQQVTGLHVPGLLVEDRSSG